MALILASVLFSAGGDGARMPDEVGHRGALDKKLEYFVRQRAAWRGKMTLEQRGASPDAAKIAHYQHRVQELEAMMQCLLIQLRASRK